MRDEGYSGATHNVTPYRAELAETGCLLHFSRGNEISCFPSPILLKAPQQCHEPPRFTGPLCVKPINHSIRKKVLGEGREQTDSEERTDVEGEEGVHQHIPTTGQTLLRFFLRKVGK